MKNILIIIRGPIGTGKTTISKILAAKINAKCFPLDDLLEKSKLNKIDPKLGCVPMANFLAVEEDILPEIEKSLERQSVIVEGAFYHKAQIDFFLNNISEDIFLVTLKANLETCLKIDKKSVKPYGVGVTKAIFDLVSKFDAGLVINIEGKYKGQIIEQIQTGIRKSETS